MYPRSGCKRLQLRKKVIRTSPSYKKRKDELGPYEEDVADALDLRKFPGWASVQNTLDCMIGYGKERPERLTDELVRQIAVRASEHSLTRPVALANLRHWITGICLGWGRMGGLVLLLPTRLDEDGSRPVYAAAGIVHNGRSAGAK